jgi:hypothetical protein
LCELRRILSPSGRLYLTIHDRHSINLFDGAYSEESLAKHMRTNDYLQRFKDNFGMVVIDRDTLGADLRREAFMTTGSSVS